MAKKSNRRRFHPIICVVVFILVWWIIPAGYKIFTKKLFNEFQAPIWDLTSRIEDLTNYWGHISDSKKTLIEKGKKISRLKSDLNLQLEREDELKFKIEKLRKLKDSIKILNKEINLQSESNYNSEIARVSIRKINSWWQQFTIRKGLNYGLKKGAGVIYQDGIIGRIHECNSRSSEIELLTNPTFRIVAHFEKDERPVRFQGNGIDLKGQPQGIVTDVPYDLSATDNQPLKLVSSSLGGNFPQGILIGIIYKLEGGENGLFKTGIVEISKNINQVHEVTVLIEQEFNRE